MQMQHAIDSLSIKLELLEHNLPIIRQEGREDDAAHTETQIADIKAALAVLRPKVTVGDILHAAASRFAGEEICVSAQHWRYSHGGDGTTLEVYRSGGGPLGFRIKAPSLEGLIEAINADHQTTPDQAITQISNS